MSINDFIVQQRLGSGSFSEVFKVQRKSDGEFYALKKVKMNNLSEKEKENALNEVRILASIVHQNIIAYKEAFFEEESQSLCIVMEFADNGDVDSKISEFKKNRNQFSENEIWSIFIQVLHGLNHLHKLQIAHRDIKCANIFINKDGIVKLGDLNVSKIAKYGLLRTQTGTPYYASPEVWENKPYNFKCDLWSLGCVIYEMAAQRPPFMGNDMHNLFQRIKKGVYPSIPPQYSKELSSVISFMLSVNPKARPSCDDLLQQNSVKNRKKLLPLALQIVEIEVQSIEADNSDDFIYNDNDNLDDYTSNLLDTIQLPNNLKQLTDRLPKSNYTHRGNSNSKFSLQKIINKKQRKFSEAESSINQSSQRDAKNEAETSQSEKDREGILIKNKSLRNQKIEPNIYISIGNERNEKMIHLVKRPIKKLKTDLYKKNNENISENSNSQLIQELGGGGLETERPRESKENSQLDQLPNIQKPSRNQSINNIIQGMVAQNREQSAGDLCPSSYRVMKCQYSIDQGIVSSRESNRAAKQLEIDNNYLNNGQKERGYSLLPGLELIKEESLYNSNQSRYLKNSSLEKVQTRLKLQEQVDQLTQVKNLRNQQRLIHALQKKQDLIINKNNNIINASINNSNQSGISQSIGQKAGDSNLSQDSSSRGGGAVYSGINKRPLSSKFVLMENLKTENNDDQKQQKKAGLSNILSRIRRARPVIHPRLVLPAAPLYQQGQGQNFNPTSQKNQAAQCQLVYPKEERRQKSVMSRQQEQQPIFVRPTWWG